MPSQTIQHVFRQHKVNWRQCSNRERLAIIYTPTRRNLLSSSQSFHLAKIHPLHYPYLMRWSRLRKILTELFDPSLDLQINCTVYRGEENSIGRYWFVLEGETVWEVPQRIAPDLSHGRDNPVASEITRLLREYVETPKEELLHKKFDGDAWGLANVLRAADRRIGKRRLLEQIDDEIYPAAKRIMEKRLSAAAAKRA